ncbi:MAG: GAF domain-containing protein [Planctomycetota bacterium]|nr:MAG: GAF domain-containing protein [Planctomycetota bacterium]
MKEENNNTLPSTDSKSIGSKDSEKEFFSLFRAVSGKKDIRPEENGWEEVYIEAPKFQKIWEEHQILSKLQRINEKISGQYDLDQLLTLVMDSAIELTSAERGFIVLKEGDQWIYKVQRNLDKESLKDPQFKISHSVIRNVLDNGKAVLTTNAKEDSRFSFFTSVQNLRLVSILCVPLRVKDTVWGALYIDNRLQEGAFEMRHLSILEAFSVQAAIAIENARLYQELRELCQEMGIPEDELLFEID